jgi:transposase
VRIAPSTVHRYLDRAGQVGLGWPGPDGLDDAALERTLFPPAPPSSVPRTPADCGWIHRELRCKGVTLQLLWMEYRQAHADGYGYSQFCARYQQWAGRVDRVMRHQHRAGDKLFVDYAGHTIPIYPPGRRAGSLEGELTGHGMTIEHRWIDPDWQYGILLARRKG